jgi:CBS domain-containing protein
MRVQEIMTTNPAWVTPDTPVRDAARLMKDQDVGLLPVVDRDESKHLLGVITDRDIAVRYVADSDISMSKSVRDVMTHDVTTCQPDNDVDDAMDLMGKEQVRRIPIVDERGSLVGVVAQADIMLQAKDGKAAKKTVEKISKPHGKHAH